MSRSCARSPACTAVLVPLPGVGRIGAIQAARVKTETHPFAAKARSPELNARGASYWATSIRIPPHPSHPYDLHPPHQSANSACHNVLADMMIMTSQEMSQLTASL